MSDTGRPTGSKRPRGMRRLACLTAYDYATARLVDDAGIPADPGGRFAGHDRCWATRHAAGDRGGDAAPHPAVARGVRRPWWWPTCRSCPTRLRSTRRWPTRVGFSRKAAPAPSRSRAAPFASRWSRRWCENGIPVLGHIGLTPQSMREIGGYKVRAVRPRRPNALRGGRPGAGRGGCVRDRAGVRAGRRGPGITDAVDVPTIGIGAGPHCDGQILVIHDMLGLHADVSPRFVKRYAELGAAMSAAFGAYREDVKAGRFPSDAQSY